MALTKATTKQITHKLPSGVVRNVYDKLGEVVSVKDFGAVGDFNPTTGSGTDNRAAIQAAFDYAISVPGGCTVIFPSGKYWLGSGYGSYSAYGVGVNLGTTTPGSASNITVIGQGAEIYAGVAKRAIGIFGANGVTISGLKVVGYTGGTINASRENDALITINYNSNNVVIENNYMTNCLGDCVYVGGSLSSGGELGYESRNITIRNNVLKERYGNGTRSYSGGTRSRLAVAVIDCVGLKIHDNVIYGGVDLEPNLDGQHLVDIAIYSNQFKSGHVTAQGTIGTSYWYDEPINLTGGAIIDQAAYATGVAGVPVVARCVVQNNTFEYGTIVDGNVYKFDFVGGNSFTSGQIISGSTSGSNTTASRVIVNNQAISPLTGQTTFIRLDGNHYYSYFADNRAGDTFSYCINNNGASTGDGGRCVFVNNTLASGTAVLGFTISATGTEIGSTKNGTGNVNLAKSSMLQSNAFYSPMVYTTAVAAGSYTFDWNTYRGTHWYVQASTGGTTVSITDITGELGDGHELTIISGAFSGGNITLVYGSGTIRTKGAVNAVIAAGESVTLVNRAGIWFEKCRSF